MDVRVRGVISRVDSCPGQGVMWSMSSGSSPRGCSSDMLFRVYSCHRKSYIMDAAFPFSIPTNNRQIEVHWPQSRLQNRTLDYDVDIVSLT